MSYASVFLPPDSGLGGLAYAPPCPKGAMAAGRSTGSCGGSETTCGGEVCCETSSWNNATYKRIKGSVTWRKWNERRVRAIFAYLLSPTPNGSPWPGEDYRYDNELAMPPALLSRIQTASYRFSLLFPAERWSKNNDCKKTDCTSRGYYSCQHESIVPATTARLAAVAQVSGVSLTAGQFESLKYAMVHRAGQKESLFSLRRLPSLPAPYKAWVAKALAAINKVRGSAGSTNVQWLPPSYEKPGNYFGVSGGSMVLLPWLQNLVNALSPPFRASFLTSKLAAKPKLTFKTSIARLNAPAAAASQGGAADPETDSEAEKGLPVGLIVGGSVVVAAGVFLLVKARGG